MKKLIVKFQALKWALSIAWDIDKRKLIWWLSLSGMISLLPAVALIFNREVVFKMTLYCTNGIGNFKAILPALIGYGVTLTFIGISSRINTNLIYMMMYDSYYLGMLELTMDKVPKIKLEDLLKRDIRDKYSFTIWRPGSLTDIMSALCQIASKFVTITSILIVAYSISTVVFFLSIFYVLLIIIINLLLTKDDSLSWDTIIGYQRNAAYYEELPYMPGVAKEIRMYQNREKLITQWHEKYSKIEKFYLEQAKDLERRNLISGVIFYIFMISVIVYSVFAVLNHTLSADTFLVLYSLCISIYQAIASFAQDILNLDRGLQAADNQRQFYSMPIFNINDESNNTFLKKDEQIVFRADHVRFGYTDKAVIDDVSFEIKKGEIIALVGCNGSGKSTLTKLLLGMFEPSEGQLWFYGVSYREINIHTIRKYVGVFFQNFFLFHHSIRENVGYGDVNNVEDAARVCEALKKGGALKLVQKMAGGINTLLKRNVDKSGVILSGGQGQRIAVSRAHMSDREVLIFDEPAAMLDPVAEMEQFINIKDTLKGHTAVLVSHRVGFARLADQVFMMQNGKIVETGTHEELIAKKGAYSYFFNEQAQWYQERGEL